MVRPPEEIKTANLIMYKHRVAEADEQFKAIDVNRDRLRPWLPWPDFVKTSADTLRNMEISHTDWENRSLFDYTLKTLKGEFLGRIGAHTIDWSVPRAEIGYWLKEEAEGKGYLLEAVPALEKELFKIGFERLEIRCDPKNVRSAKIPERLGYTMEATLKNNIRRQGTLRDSMIWAKLRHER